MKTNLLFLGLLLLFVSCEGDDTIILSENVLSEYLEFYGNRKLDEVIACAASNEENTAAVNVYFYPIIGSSDIRYYETENTVVDPNNFSNYTLQNITSNSVLGGKLSQFNRIESYESWGIVTFLSEGKIHKSNPIRLKQLTNTTEYTFNGIVDTSEPKAPNFSWFKSSANDDVIYFQALVESTGNFVSGTYTTDLWFKYYDTSNVVLDINLGIPEDIDITKEYVMNIMAVSEDNWVNLHTRINF